MTTIKRAPDRSGAQHSRRSTSALRSGPFENAPVVFQFPSLAGLGTFRSRGALLRVCLRGVALCVGPSWTPSIVPNGNDQTVYLVADDFGKPGRAWVEADYEATDLETVIQDLLTGQDTNPIRVIAFNTAERWPDDVSEDIAHELRRRCDLQMRDVPFFPQDFVDRYEDIQLPLPMRLM
jgi:hypothetical protein